MQLGFLIRTVEITLMTAINHLQGRTGLRSSFIWGWMLFTSPILRRSCEGGCFRFVCLARAAQIAPGLYCLASPSESGQNCSISCHSVDPYHNSHLLAITCAAVILKNVDHKLLYGLLTMIHIIHTIFIPYPPLMTY